MRTMFCTCLAGLVLFTLFPMCAFAQRHGRPDAVQNYMKSARPLNQELSLNFEATHSWVYFHLKDLRQMKRTTVRVTDPATHLTISYEGVSLNELVPDGLANDRFEVFKESWGFHDKRALWSDDLNMESEMIVADTINGQKLAGETPFYFAATAKRGDVIVVKRLAHIKFVATAAEHQGTN
jgi:hypothetical protein